MTNEKALFNVHTHVFDRDCIPPDILGEKWGWVLKKLLAAKSDALILRILQFLTFFFRNSGILERAKMLFRAFAMGGQKPVIENLIREYKDVDPNINFKFVILCQDMDCNGVPKPKKDLRAQADEIARIKDIFKSTGISEAIIPFLGIHPDNYSDSTKLMSFVRHYIEEKKFAGIKIYPASGHYPDDIRLGPLWKYCESNLIPVMTHATCGPIYYRGKDIDRKILNPRPHPNLLKSNEIQANFTSTFYFKKVLKDYPALKICFGHCGGHSNTHETDIQHVQHGWMMDILNFCKDYKNVYFDISFINYSLDTLNYLKTNVNNFQNSGPHDINTKILYGTDYYVNKHKCDEKKAFQNSAQAFDINQIAGLNPKNYLSSKFHTF